MRILIQTDKDLKKLERYLKKELYIFADIIPNDIEETEAYILTRKYKLLFIDLEEKDKLTILNILKIAETKNIKVFVYKKKLSKIEKENYQKYKGVSFLEDFSEKTLKETIKLNAQYNIKKEDIKINLKKKTVYVKFMNKEHKFSFKRLLDFYVFLYFIRNYGESLSTEELLNATVLEPEEVKNSMVTISINNIRKKFKEVFNINPISAHRTKGYTLYLPNTNLFKI